MANFEPAYIFLAIIIIVIIIWLIGFVFFTKITAKPPDFTPPTNNQCVKSTNELFNLTGALCCCTQGNQTSLRPATIQGLPLVLSTSSTFYLDACAGFCEDGMYNSSSETCKSGSNSKFQDCINLSKPQNCQGLALPVAVDGIQFYYINSATMDQCTSTGDCAPKANDCPNGS